MASDLQRGVDALRKFQRDIEHVIENLEKGAGGASTLNQNRVTRAAFGTGIPFAEADGLFTAYEHVHGSLVSLSKSLSGQIELLQIGVHAADVGYDNVEEDQRRQFHSIQARLSKERDEAIEREEQARAKDPAQPAERRSQAGTTTEEIG
ncbi:hypothetical protein ACFCZ6_12325 [Streptomyces hydrogenans]|uniref:hypothetical protein n=1 Tax=Streptomyces hydrogenans TaxID=1873719 RepID=UPI0035E2398F